jgi:hypothetical protein
LSQNQDDQAKQGIGTNLQQDVKQKPVAFIPIGQILTERVLWHRDIRRGIIHKEVIIEERITNMRIFRYNVETHTLLSQITLKSNPDVIVANSRRRSQSSGGGLYGGGTFVSSRVGTSRSFGDVVIMKDGVINTKLSNVADPQGVKQLINTLKREVAAAQKQTLLRQRPIPMMVKRPTARGILCKNCGTQLPVGSNFCNKCGAIQN